MVYVLRTGHDRGPSRLASRPPQACMSVPPRWYRFPNALTKRSLHAVERTSPCWGCGPTMERNGSSRLGFAVPPRWDPLPTARWSMTPREGEAIQSRLYRETTALVPKYNLARTATQRRWDHGHSLDPRAPHHDGTVVPARTGARPSMLIPAPHHEEEEALTEWPHQPTARGHRCKGTGERVPMSGGAFPNALVSRPHTAGPLLNRPGPCLGRTARRYRGRSSLEGCRARSVASNLRNLFL